MTNIPNKQPVDRLSFMSYIQNHEMVRLDSLVELLIDKNIITKEELQAKMEAHLKELDDRLKKKASNIIIPSSNLTL